MAYRPLWVKKLLGLKNSISVVPLSPLSRMLTVSKASWVLWKIHLKCLTDEVEVVVVARVAKRVDWSALWMRSVLT